MPVDKKVMFSVLLLCAGVLGYWIEVAMGMERNIPYLIVLVVFLMLGLWSMSAVQKKDEGNK
ncbi:MAG: hypothetical protein Q8S92_18035 [Hydrogenophaga sp.]|jgi:hypothetical protein|uniref:hypothetical protein n=1 Tax=Burkholderiales TaxID=80840 RepID=UPI000468F68E|nr:MULTISPECIES: hypothetical protein [Burkholderiales]MBU0791863.1 hypothetical protein [Gammaproteobacteria bacterium]MDP3350889.1 hypothetical protein [Hydrogenophaga sp.]|tara:strand:+ start:729 stop:914 length:186 start_codon:yes stop_codon:yes gene_type:complete